MGRNWTPNAPERLEAQVQEITYEVRWLQRGHDISRELTSKSRRIGSLAESDVGNLALEAALVHLRALLDFLFPRESAKRGDVVACEYLPGWSGGLASPLMPGRERLGESIPQLRTALDGWLAHLGSLRARAPNRPDWGVAMRGCLSLIVDWHGRLDDPWRDKFREARACAELSRHD